MKGRGGVRGVENKDILLSKETYYSVKRDLLQWQKRPTTVSKETHYSVKKTSKTKIYSIRKQL
jgi:hypothetical protein